MEAIIEAPVNSGSNSNQPASAISLRTDIPRTMKAAVVREFGAPLQIEEVPVKMPNDNQILVKVIACGVCHTDLHAVNGDWPVQPQLPLIPGHEAIGYVVAKGRFVTGVNDGDIVGVPWLASACGCCEFCITGWETLCDMQQNGGYSVDGGFAEYVFGRPKICCTLAGRYQFHRDGPDNLCRCNCI